MQTHLAQALRDLRRTWPQLLITDLLSVALTIIVTTPLVGLLLKLFLLATEGSVLTDADIAAFFMRPLGVVALVLLGGVALGVALIQLALLMVIGFGASEDRRVTYLDALLYVFRSPARFFSLAGAIVARMLLLSAPFLAALGGVYLMLLREHDINYYLAARPPDFRTALMLAGVLLALLGLLLLRTLAGWLLALPLLLFTDVPAAHALGRSRELIGKRRWRIAGILAAWGGATLLISTIASFLLGQLGSLLLPGFDQSLFLFAVGLALTLALTALAHLAIRVVSGSLLPLLIVRWFLDLAGPGQLRTPLAAPGTLGARPTWELPGRTLLVAAAALLLAVTGGAYAFARSIDAQEHPAIIAHRGASAGAPENTMAAFELALAEGADWIELDVQETADGVVIVAHDNDFMKQARTSLKVWDATLEDLDDIDIGSWFDPSFGDQRVQTLHQVLEWAHGRIGILIELKYYGHDHSLEARVAQLVEASGSQSEVMVMSLKRPGLARFAELRPTWPRGLLNTASLGDLTRLDVNFLALNAAAATRHQIRAAHSQGMQVYAWTVNDPIQMSVLLSRGADGLITDEPARAQRVLELREQLSPIGQFLVWVAGETGLLQSEGESSVESDA